MYYLNVMAGPGERRWLICDDPAHAWIRQTWEAGNRSEAGDVMRLTVGQAIVAFLAAQYSERDGDRAPADRRLLRHLRARQRGWPRRGAARGRAAEPSCRGLAALLPGPQRAGDGARRGGFRPDAQSAVDAGLHHFGRSGRDQHGHRRGLATINRLPVLLLPSDVFATRVADPVLQQLEHPSQRDVSANDTFRPVSRFFDRVDRPEHLPDALLGAMRER